jgi:CubicO group peptidase (beta-lactamase class C family)
MTFGYRAILSRPHSILAFTVLLNGEILHVNSDWSGNPYGYIQSVDQPVTDFIPELSEKGFSNVTIHHLLTMTSGSSYVENDNPFGIHVVLNYTPVLEQKILQFQMKEEPGRVWRYKSGDNALLGLILHRALAPKTITEYTQERLWTLGMEYKGVWSLELGMAWKTWCCMAAAARDFLKLGRLYLHEGLWDGEQVVPAEWVRQSVKGSIPYDVWDADYRRIGVWNYGYQWWLISEEEGSFLANGKDGQYLYVNPIYRDFEIRMEHREAAAEPVAQFVSQCFYWKNKPDCGCFHFSL